MVDFLRLTASTSRSTLCQAASPFRTRRPAMPKSRARRTCSLEELSQLLAQIESDGKGVPILLKQYLKLGGRMLGFNLDDQFGDALDGLVVVDLRRTDIGVLCPLHGRGRRQRPFSDITVQRNRTEQSATEPTQQQLPGCLRCQRGNLGQCVGPPSLTRQHAPNTRGQSVTSCPQNRAGKAAIRTDGHRRTGDRRFMNPAQRPFRPSRARPDPRASERPRNRSHFASVRSR